jgi:hypothetical protein
VASVLVLERALPDETRRTPRPLLARVARPCYNEQECAGSPSSSSPLS